jgi:hypothetical protein
MPFLLVIVALIAPRVVLFMLWFLTTWPRGMFHTLLWPILGFILLPTTLLCYMVVQHWFGGHWTLWPVVAIVIALLIDLSPTGGRRWLR